MAARTIALELPEGLLELLGPPDAIAGKVRETLVLDLLREAQITQGQAARLLGVTRYDTINLMALHSIPSGPETADEAERDFAAARQGVQLASVE